MITADAPSPPPNATMDSATFRAAIRGATLPGFVARIESDLAGTFVVWTPVGFEAEAELYATPEWEESTGVAIMLHHPDGVMFVDDVAVAWTDDPIVNVHLYLACMQSWLTRLPTIYGQWDGGDDRDFSGTIIDWYEKFRATILLDGSLWDGEPARDFFAAVDHAVKSGETVYCDNMALRASPFPTDDDVLSRVAGYVHRALDSKTAVYLTENEVHNVENDPNAPQGAMWAVQPEAWARAQARRRFTISNPKLTSTGVAAGVDADVTMTHPNGRTVALEITVVYDEQRGHWRPCGGEPAELCCDLWLNDAELVTEAEARDLAALIRVSDFTLGGEASP
jgi:hypothetical protein